MSQCPICETSHDTTACPQYVPSGSVPFPYYPAHPFGCQCPECRSHAMPAQPFYRPFTDPQLLQKLDEILAELRTLNEHMAVHFPR